MVKIELPPPTHPPDPIWETVRAGRRLIRIYCPTSYGATPCTFRINGPRRRFDHQRADASGAPRDDPERGISYAAYDLDGCVVEVFGNERMVVAEDYHVAVLDVVSDLLLLDLHYNAAMRAGTVASVGQNADHAPSQTWSQYFYEHSDIYKKVDGLIYLNAHNNNHAIALYERARDRLECRPENVRRLDHPALRPELERIGATPTVLIRWSSSCHWNRSSA